MLAVNLILGAVVLLFGRQLFWAFVAIAGFLIGVEVAGIFLADQAVWLQITVGAGLGIVSAVIAIVAQRVGFALAGFYAIGYLGVIGGNEVLPGSNPLVWFVLGGLAGAIVAVLLLDPAIIVLSSFVGATVMVTQMTLTPVEAVVTLIGLIIVGIAFQSRSLQRERGSASRMSDNRDASE